MNEEKSLHHVKGLPMSSVNSAKNKTTTMSKMEKNGNHRKWK